MRTITPPDGICIERWGPTPGDLSGDLVALGELLHACIHGGASVSFVLPFSRADAESFWRDQVLPAVNAGSRRVLLARSAGRIVGTAQLDFAVSANQPHRAEVKKVLVHPDLRRRGVARSLMLAVEEEARDGQRTLLVLDCVTDGAGEKLYTSMGYLTAGVIPRYSLNFDSTKLQCVTIMYKELR
jgi:GNAT superfamily N-acetyltransferase